MDPLHIFANSFYMLGCDNALNSTRDMAGLFPHTGVGGNIWKSTESVIKKAVLCRAVAGSLNKKGKKN